MNPDWYGLNEQQLIERLADARSAVQRLEAENEDLKLQVERANLLLANACQGEAKARAQVEVLNDTIQQLFAQMRL
jgi:hypothetical protein